MEFHSVSHNPPKAIDPDVDPAYHDGLAPRRRLAKPAGEITLDWPVTRIPPALRRLHTISIEALEDEIEREAAREEIA
jgi:hypothetical protein